MRRYSLIGLGVAMAALSAGIVLWTMRSREREAPRATARRAA